MHRMDAAAARGPGAFKGETQARAEFRADERFQIVAYARNIGFGGFAPPVGNFRWELD